MADSDKPLIDVKDLNRHAPPDPAKGAPLSNADTHLSGGRQAPDLTDDSLTDDDMVDLATGRRYSDGAPVNPAADSTLNTDKAGPQG